MPPIQGSRPPRRTCHGDPPRGLVTGVPSRGETRRQPEVRSSGLPPPCLEPIPSRSQPESRRPMSGGWRRSRCDFRVAFNSCGYTCGLTPGGEGRRGERAGTAGPREKRRGLEARPWGIALPGGPAEGPVPGRLFCRTRKSLFANTSTSGWGRRSLARSVLCRPFAVELYL